MEVVHWRNLFLACLERIILSIQRFLIHLLSVMVKWKEDIMQIQRVNVKYFTFVAVMAMEDLQSTAFFAQMEPFFSRSILSVIGGSMWTVPYQNSYIQSMIKMLLKESHIQMMEVLEKEL